MARWRSRRWNRDPQVSGPGDGHGPAHTGQEARDDTIPECRVWERVLIHPITVHQSTTGLMEEASVHSNTRNIGPKSRLPDVAGNSPWGEELGHILQVKQG